MPRTFVFAFAMVLLASVLVQFANAQCTPPTQRTSVVVTDNGAGRDTLWFGFDPTGTYGLNTPLCEIELPPAPPTGVFDVRWVNTPGHDGMDTPAGLGQGFKQDYRALAAGVTDTFKVKFQPGDGGYPFHFRWATAGVIAIYDSAVLQDEFGGILLRVRMDLQDSALVTSPALSSLLLIAKGQKTTSVEPISNEIPSEFALSQNYPNPFNPTTTIRFAVKQFAKTDVAVFDILGRKIATLVSEPLAPGVYSVNWNGKNDLGVTVASGIYLLRMTAVDDQNGSFTAMRKLVFMK